MPTNDDTDDARIGSGAKAPRPSVLRAALLAPANLFGMLSAGVASALLGDPTPAYVALGAQAVYLGSLPFVPRFRRALRAAAAASGDDAARTRTGRVGEVRGETQALLEALAPSQRAHYAALRALRDQLLGNYANLPGGGVLVASSQAQVDALLVSFLRLLGTLNAYRAFLSTAKRTELERELAMLRVDAAAEEDVRLREVKRRRVEILEKRLERYAHAEESRELISHQLASIEDLLRLTHEQSVAIRDPDSLTHQLDVLTAEADATEATVRDLERFMSFTQPIDDAGASSGTGARTGGGRVRD